MISLGNILNKSRQVLVHVHGLGMHVDRPKRRVKERLLEGTFNRRGDKALTIEVGKQMETRGT